jgi:NitT/TauT family transport system ATP-binding protein
MTYAKLKHATRAIFDLAIQNVRVSPDELAGLSQTLAHISCEGHTELRGLAEKIGFDDERLLALLKVLCMLGFTELTGSTVALTSVGLNYARTTARKRRPIFAERLAAGIPWVDLIRRKVAADPDKKVRLAEIATELRDQYPAAVVERGLRRVIDWARYAGLFFYDDRTGVISLERAGRIPKNP